MLDDFYLVTASVDGTTGSLRDDTTLAMETGFFKGMQGYVVSGPVANLERVVNVTSSDGPNHTIYFEPALPVAVAAGNQVELYNRKKQGATVAQYNEAINAAIRTISEQHNMIPYETQTVSLFNRKFPDLAIPTDFAAVYGVSIVNPTGVLQRIPAKYVSIDRDTATLSVGTLWGQRANGRYLMIHGYKIPSELTTDDQTIEVEAEWLYPEIKAIILERHIASGIPIGTQDRIFMQERDQADKKRNIAIRRYAPNTVRLYTYR